MTVRPRDRVALGVVLLVALVGAYYLLVLKPERHKASTVAAAIAGQRRTLAEAQQNYVAGRAAQASLKMHAPEWAALSLAVPNTSDIPALLRTLEHTANAVHVKMQAIVLSDAAGTTAGAPVPTTSGATSVPLQLTFAGSYTALNSLVGRLDGLVVVSGSTVHATGPLLSISNVSLTGTANLTVQLTATIYQLDVASSAAGVPTGGQP
jgi:Tfp pilus assembly protein PilO